MGRPVISSRVTNGLDVLEGAIVEARVNDVESYIAAIRRLRDDPAAYEAACRACSAHQRQYFDRDRGWGAACARAIRTFVPDFGAPAAPAVARG